MSKKTLIIVGSSILGVLIILLLVVWLLTVFGNHYLTYEKAEEKIAEATEKYYKNNPELLPVSNGRYNLSYNALVEKEYIKPLNKILKDGDKCSAEILVVNKDGNYDYIPKLSCGDTYETRELYKQVLNDNKIVTEGSGLYSGEDGSYYFRGKVDNNYVALGELTNKKNTPDILWQIISIDSDNTIRMKAISHTEDRTPFDNRYNEEKAAFSGYNDFKNSTLKEFLINLDKTNSFLTATEKTKLIAKEVCAGKTNEKDKTKSGNNECSEKTDEKLIFSTMLPYEYMRASLDTNCKTVFDYSCSNFNFLSSNDTNSEWSSIGDTAKSYLSLSFNGAAYDSSTCKSEKYIYPVVTVNEYAFIKSGTGTQSDPYRLFKKSTN